jgi:hypothetical protein
LFDNFFELKVDVCVLMFGGRGVLKLRAYDVSLFGGDVGKDMKEVGWGVDDGGWGMGTIGGAACDKMITTWTRVIPGVVGAIEVVLDNLVGGGDVDLVGVVNLRPVGNGKGEGDNKGW